ncbi:MAG: hypothetical protein ACLT3Y_00105 [Ruminococcus callidus]
MLTLQQMLRSMRRHRRFGTSRNAGTAGGRTLFHPKKPAYDQIERQFFQSYRQFGTPSGTTKPRPVCGALEHPHPAACTEDTVPKARNPSSVRCKTWRPRTRNGTPGGTLPDAGISAAKAAGTVRHGSDGGCREVRQLLEQLQMSIRENQQKLAALKIG